mgnify:CR=1 FL=1
MKPSVFIFCVYMGKGEKEWKTPLVDTDWQYDFCYFQIRCSNSYSLYSVCLYRFAKGCVQSFAQSFAIRFTHKRLNIYKPTVSLDGQWANILRSKRCFAFNVFTHNYTLKLTAWTQRRICTDFDGLITLNDWFCLHRSKWVTN